MNFSEFQPLAGIATTPLVAKKLLPVCQALGGQLWIPESLAETVTGAGIRVYQGSLKDQLTPLWQTHQGLIFGLAAGAVVRLIAPLLQHKSIDPAVVVVDEQGKFAISLCSGHQGGGDRLAQVVSRQLSATPVITGASAGLGLPGIDVLGIPYGWRRGQGDWTAVSAAISRKEAVEVLQTHGSTLWQKHLPKYHPFQFQSSPAAKARVFIGVHQPESAEIPQIVWHPRILWVGIGCERGTSQTLISQAIQGVFQSQGWATEAIAGLATIDLKSDEVGLLEYCQIHDLPLKTFSADVLKTVEVPTPSPVVQAEVGTPSVAEAAALSAAQTSHLLLTKQIFRLKGEAGAVTIAIAQSPQEYTGRTGKIWLVGTGPGELQQITPAAQTAITQADVIIGYSLYIDLITSLLRPGQIVEALPITQERQRGDRAIELANWGLTVAVVSSGDCGIYGMAGLVLEQLQNQGWDGKTPEIQVFPGISALQAAASRVGAPLMHDFCAISLSDLLTPWDVIEKRLHAAAQADFVTALYNPRSQTRTQQLLTAIDIFLKYRDPQTPVAVVKSAYRPDEKITLTTLEKLPETPVDMLTTVMIGNQSTKHHAGWLITPRGYLGKAV